MLQDLRLAVRTLIKSPGPSTIAVLVLALGLGANITVFSLFNGLVLEPLGFERPDRLVRVFGTEAAEGRDRQRVSEAEAQLALDQLRGFEHIAASRNTGLSLTAAERPFNPLMREVSAGWFEMLGVEPLLGRTFTAEEHRQGARLVLLHHSFWQAQYGGDPQVLGQTIELAYEPYEVIGVMPPSYRNEAYPEPPVLWLPMAESPTPDTGRRTTVLFARLAEGSTLDRAQQEIDLLSAELADRYPEAQSVRGLRVATLHDSLIERFRPALLVLLAAVGFVLMIACANVANLLLTRALGRRQEIALRQALGAGRLHLARQLLTESLLISLTGAGLGILAAFWSIAPISRLVPASVNMPLLDRVQIEPRVLLFSLVLAGLTTLLFGLLPLRQLFQSSGAVLSAGSRRTSGGRSRRRLRSALVVAELALSMVLLVGAGLTVRSLANLRGLELGLEPEGLLVGRVGARGPGFEAPDRWEPFHRQTLERISTLPGVEAVGGIEFLPIFAGGFGLSTPVAPAGTDLSPDSRFRATVMSVLPGYFDAAGQSLLSGRDVSVRDVAAGEQVAVISRTLARKLWGNEDPVGRTLLVGDDEDLSTVRLIGVAGDLRGLADNPEPPPILFRPLAQRPFPNVTLFIRHRGTDESRLMALLPAIEDQVWSISRDAPVYNFATMAQMIRNVEWQPRFVVQLLTGFAILALVLAATGIYAVLAYAVRERTREIGIRVAVGADRREILTMVGREALRLSVFGVGLGTVGALAASQGLESQLLGITPHDPSTYALLAVGLTSVGLVASFVPALRATRVDPVEALRGE